jgi:hypothetical protein
MAKILRRHIYYDETFRHHRRHCSFFSKLYYECTIYMYVRIYICSPVYFPPRALRQLCNVLDRSQIWTVLDFCSWFLLQWSLSGGKSLIIASDNRETYLSAGGSVHVIHLFRSRAQGLWNKLCSGRKLSPGVSEKCAEENMRITISLYMGLQSFCWTSAAFSASYSYT